MKKMMTIASLLLMTAALAAPASANYFSNAKTNTGLAIGSAKNPTPEMLRAIGDSKHGATIMGSKEDADLLENSSTYSDSSTYEPQVSMNQTVTFTNTKFAAMEGKIVIGAHGARLGRVLAVDHTNRLVQVQTPGGIAVSMSADLLSNKGRIVSAPTTSKLDVMAMAKTQTGRTVALDLGTRGDLRG